MTIRSPLVTRIERREPAKSLHDIGPNFLLGPVSLAVLTPPIPKFKFENPFGRKAPFQDYIAPNLLPGLLQTVNVAPFKPFLFENPQGRKQTIQDFVSANLLPALLQYQYQYFSGPDFGPPPAGRNNAAALRFDAPNLLNTTLAPITGSLPPGKQWVDLAPARRPYPTSLLNKAGGALLDTTAAVLPAGRQTFDLPAGRLYPQVLRDWTNDLLQSTLKPAFVQPPFYQLDWPNPVRRPATVPAGDSIFPNKLTTTMSAVPQFEQKTYSNPDGRSYPRSLLTETGNNLLENTLAMMANPHRVREFQNPQLTRYPGALRTFEAPNLLLTTLSVQGSAHPFMSNPSAYALPPRARSSSFSNFVTAVMGASFYPHPQETKFMSNGILFTDPRVKPLSSYGLQQMNCTATFYLSNTTTLANIFADGALSIPLANPIQADSSGRFVPIYLDPTIVYRVILKDKNGSTFEDTDPYNVPGGAPIPLTAGESANGFTTQTINITFPPGSFLRYGIIPNVAALASENTAILKQLVAPAGSIAGTITSPNTTGSDTYYFSDMVQFHDYITVKGEGCIWSFAKTGVASDSNNSFIFALRGFRAEDLKVVVNYTPNGSSNAGNAFGFGGRDVPVAGSPLPTIYDSLLTEPLGNIALKNIKVITNAPGSCGVLMYGGIQNIETDNFTMDGGGVATGGLVYEYGFATNEAATSARQSSHMNNARFTNTRIKNLATTASNGGINLGGAYNVTIDGLYVNGAQYAVNLYPGEAAFYRPWVGVDDVGAKRNININNVVASNVVLAFSLAGAQLPVANAGYLWSPWVAGATFVTKQTCINGGNVYVCTNGGVAAGSGGPTGTGSGISDGSVTWNYIPLSAWTDLYDVKIDGFAVQGTAANFGIGSSVGKLDARNGAINGFIRGVVTTDECTMINLTNLRVTGSTSIGIEIGQGVDVYGTPRKSTGIIQDCFVAGNGTIGGAPGIAMSNTGSMLVQRNRIGYDVNHDGIAEATQTNAIDIDATCFGVKCDGNECQTAGGNIAYAQVGTSASQSCSIASPLGLTTYSGNWAGVLQHTTCSLSAATPGSMTLASVTAASMDYIQRDGEISYTFEWQGTPTWGSTSGAVRITGLPIAASNAAALGSLPLGSLEFSGVTLVSSRVGGTQLTPYGTGGQTYLQIAVSGTGIANADLLVADVPTAQPVKFFGSGKIFI